MQEAKCAQNVLWRWAKAWLTHHSKGRSAIKLRRAAEFGRWVPEETGWVSCRMIAFDVPMQ